MKTQCVFCKVELSIIKLSRLIPVFKKIECVNFITPPPPKKKRTCHNNKYHCTLSNTVVLSYARMLLKRLTLVSINAPTPTLKTNSLNYLEL
jgi:hypothetical protein